MTTETRVVICRVWTTFPFRNLRLDGVIFFPETKQRRDPPGVCDLWEHKEAWRQTQYTGCADLASCITGPKALTRPATATETRKLLAWYRKHWAGLPPDCGPCPILEVRQKETSAMREKRRAMFNSR